MEPKNHPFEKENHLPKLHEDMFQPFIFRGVLVDSPPGIKTQAKTSGYLSVCTTPVE